MIDRASLNTQNESARNPRRAAGSKQPLSPRHLSEVTDRIISALETGVAPWAPAFTIERPGYPRNGATGRAYRGVNVLLLWLTAMERGYLPHEWFTFSKACEAVGLVRDKWTTDSRGREGDSTWREGDARHLLEATGTQGEGCRQVGTHRRRSEASPLLCRFYVWNRTQIDARRRR